MSFVTYFSRFTTMSFLVLIAQSAYSVDHEKKCGDYIYGVEIALSGDSYRYKYALYYKKGSQEKNYFFNTSTTAYLTTSCVQDIKGKYYFFFQQFCGTINCQDSPNNLYDPEAKKMVLKFDDNVLANNDLELKKILGYGLPFMFDDERTFCCDYTQAPLKISKFNQAG